jgi:hypothetical protein
MGVILRVRARQSSSLLEYFLLPQGEKEVLRLDLAGQHAAEQVRIDVAA